MLLTSCSNELDNKNKSQINVWYYDYMINKSYDDVADFIIEEMKKYASENNIIINVIKYSSEELTYKDYVLKRNAALATNQGDIVIDWVNNLYSARQYGGDYSKLSTYNNIFEGFRNGYCIPVGFDMRFMVINNDVMKHYGVKTETAITNEEYYELKEKLKQAGAKFAANEEEKREIRDYYIYKNQLKIIYENNKYIIDTALLKKTINEIYREYMKIGNENAGVEEDVIFDLNTDCILKNSHPNSPYFMALTKFSQDDPSKLQLAKHIKANNRGIYDCTMVIKNGYEHNAVPCIMINKNSKKEEAYKLASILFSDKIQKNIYDRSYGVVADTENIRDKIEVDSNWKCIRQYEILNQFYDIKEKGYSMLKNSNQSYFFENASFKSLLKNFITNEINKKMKAPNLYDDDTFEKNTKDFINNLNVKFN